MSLFWFIFPFVVVFFAYFGDERVTRNKVASLWSRVFLLLTLSVVLATCGGVYTDHETYSDFYYYFSKTKGVEFTTFRDFFLIKTEGLVSPVENGFAFLLWSIGQLNFSHVGFFFIIGGITNYFIIKAFYRFKYPTIIFLLYIISVQYQQEFNLVRQMMAVSMIFYALRYVEENNWKKYLLYAIVAFTIHQSSIVSILFLPFCFTRERERIWKVARIILGVVFTFSFLVAIRFIPFNLTFITVYFDLYAGYVTNEDTIGVGDQSMNLLYNLIVILTIIQYRKGDQKYLYIIFMIIGCIISNIAVQTPNLNRIALYFSIAYLPLVPCLLKDGYLFKKQNLSEMTYTLFIIYNCAVIAKFILTGNNIIGSKMESIFNFFI